MYILVLGGMQWYLKRLNRSRLLVTRPYTQESHIIRTFIFYHARISRVNLKEYIDKHSFVNGLSYKEQLVEYTYESKVNGSRSIIDHFIMSSNMFESIATYKSKHSVDNFSDHSPLIMSLELPTHHERSDPVCRSDMISQCNWDMASTENISLYKAELDELLHDHVDVPWEAIKCKHVNSRVHTNEVDRYHEALIQCCMLASTKSIPSAGKAVNNTKKGSNRMEWLCFWKKRKSNFLA